MRWRRGSRRQQVDVVVVGAGFAGLAAADRLVASGLDVLVLEEADRVGGRTWTVEDGGTWLELGGMWTGPGQPLLSALVDRFGLATFPQHDEGRHLLVHHGAALTDADADVRWSDVDRYVGALDALARTVPPDAPWTAPDADALDTLTLDRWLAAEVPDADVRHQLEVVLTELMCVPADELSLLTLLHAGTTSGSLAAALGVEDGAQERRVLHGIQAAARALAEELGDRVRLGTGVDRLSWNADGAIVDLADGPVMARHVVVAMAPSSCERIDFEPVLPLRRVAAQRRMPLGSVIKVCAVYDRPFWREQGLSGTAFSPYELSHEAYDNTNHGDERGTLVGFVSDLHADGVFELSAEERKERILTSLSHYYGPEAMNPVVYFESDWGSEEWTRGAYAASFDLGGLHRYGADLRSSVGPIHFACSDLAGAGYQHVDGAIRMGRLAAEQILQEARA